MRAAADVEELAELERRHADVRRELCARGCSDIADAFAKAVDGSKAVIARPLADIEKLTRSDSEVFSTYYKQIEAQLRLPDTSEWDVMRRIAEEALFPGYKENIRFASLTLQDRGLPSYGECHFTLQTHLIDDRASVFEENGVLFMLRRDLKFTEMARLPRGRRARWADRAKLCLAKLGHALRPDTPTAEFPSLLLRPGKSTAEDDFVEVHVWGPITVRTIEKVVLLRPPADPNAELKLRGWREKLENDYGVKLDYGVMMEAT